MQATANSFKNPVTANDEVRSMAYGPGGVMRPMGNKN